MTPLSIDLNCDLGELPGDEGRAHDRRLMRWISSANVACGGHAGDPSSMRATVQAARDLQIAVGAHPGFTDRASMGRLPRDLSIDQIRDLVRDQTFALHQIAKDEGYRLSHVKPHGALYNLAAVDTRSAGAICDAIVDLGLQIRVYGLSGSRLLAAAQGRGLATASEVFADRQYQPDGLLVPRDHPGACLGDPQVIADRAARMVLDRIVLAVDGTSVAVEPQTLCLHGDHPRAEEICVAVARQLTAAGVQIRAPL
jgi:UPF0271 protein